MGNSQISQEELKGEFKLFFEYAVKYDDQDGKIRKAIRTAIKHKHIYVGEYWGLAYNDPYFNDNYSCFFVVQKEGDSYTWYRKFYSEEHWDDLRKFRGIIVKMLSYDKMSHKRFSSLIQNYDRSIISKWVNSNFDPPKFFGD